jgi:GTP cyclohydrolase III
MLKVAMVVPAVVERMVKLVEEGEMVEMRLGIGMERTARMEHEVASKLLIPKTQSQA